MCISEAKLSQNKKHNLFCYDNVFYGPEDAPDYKACFQLLMPAVLFSYIRCKMAREFHLSRTPNLLDMNRIS